MEPVLLNKIILSFISFFLVFAVSFLAKSRARKIQQEKNLSRGRYYTLKKFIGFLSLTVLAGVFILIWGINVKDLWMSVTGVIAMIAVAFFAVWSLIGNILAGIILFFTSPFKAGDTIELLPDGVKGKVLAINSFFTLLSDDEENIVSVPNSLLFQKYIKKMKKKRSA